MSIFVEQILKISESFRQVIITVRTQFFPVSTENLIEKGGRIEISGYLCNLIYLSPFSDAQVEAYLQKIFPNNYAEKLWKWYTGRDNAKLTQARRIVIPMRSLRMRPMLLAHVDEFMDHPIDAAWDEYTIYGELIYRWLQRESRNTGLSAPALGNACEYLALRLQERGVRHIPDPEFQSLCDGEEALRELEKIDIGGRSLLNKTADESWRFSHYTIQEFLAVRRLSGGALHPSEPTKILCTDMISEFLHQGVRKGEINASRFYVQTEGKEVPYSDARVEDMYNIVSGVNAESLHQTGVTVKMEIICEGTVLKVKYRPGHPALGVKVDTKEYKCTRVSELFPPLEGEELIGYLMIVAYKPSRLLDDPSGDHSWQVEHMHYISESNRSKIIKRVVDGQLKPTTDPQVESILDHAHSTLPPTQQVYEHISVKSGD